jgi:hypothetical protein
MSRSFSYNVVELPLLQATEALQHYRKSQAVAGGVTVRFLQRERTTSTSTIPTRGPLHFAPGPVAASLVGVVLPAHFSNTSLSMTVLRRIEP